MVGRNGGLLLSWGHSEFSLELSSFRQAGSCRCLCVPPPGSACPSWDGQWQPPCYWQINLGTPSLPASWAVWGCGLRSGGSPGCWVGPQDPAPVLGSSNGDPVSRGFLLRPRGSQKPTELHTRNYLQLWRPPCQVTGGIQDPSGWEWGVTRAGFVPRPLESGYREV